MNLPLYIAKRIYNDKGDKHRVSKPVIHIAVAGVAIGLAVMIVSVSIIFGFKHTIRNKVVGFGSHITVAGFDTFQSPDQVPVVVNDSLMKVLRNVKGVKHVQRYAMTQGILKTDSDFLGVAFKGLAEEYDTAFLHKHLVEGRIPRFSDSHSSNDILVSANIAGKLGLKVGQRIFAYFIGNGGVRMRRFSIVGIYRTNLTQFDKQLCFIDLYTAGKLNGWTPDRVTGAELTVNRFENLDSVAAGVVNKVNRTTDKYGEVYSSQTIIESYPQIFHWLDLLDLNVWVILGLMMAVAGVTMVSGLLIIILERTTMIGLLKALGARNSTIRHTFLWFSAFLIGRGLLIGNVVALLLLAVQHVSGVVKLDPTIYYVDTVPVEFNWPVFLALNMGTLLISIFVLIAPSYLISRILPAKSMRYE